MAPFFEMIDILTEYERSVTSETEHPLRNTLDGSLFRKLQKNHFGHRPIEGLEDSKDFIHLSETTRRSIEEYSLCFRNRLECFDQHGVN